MKRLFATLFFLCFISEGALAETAGGYLSKDAEAYDKEDFVTAAELFQKTCNAGEAFGCGALGLMYYNGVGIKQDYFKAAELYQKACDGEEANGCGLLGLLYEYGQGVRADKQKALNLFGKACDLRVQEGCENYARLKKELGQ